MKHRPASDNFSLTPRRRILASKEKLIRCAALSERKRLHRLLKTEQLRNRKPFQLFQRLQTLPNSKLDDSALWSMHRVSPRRAKDIFIHRWRRTHNQVGWDSRELNGDHTKLHSFPVSIWQYHLTGILSNYTRKIKGWCNKETKT